MTIAAHDLTCVAHVHSTFSDGTATPGELVAAAAHAGAHAVLLTDHDSLQAAREGHEGWHGDVLLLVGEEVTTRRGHLLAFGIDSEIEHRGRSEEEICAELAARGGFGFAAHPFSRGGFPSWIIRPHPWLAIARCEGCGVEVWSVLTDTAERWRGPLGVLRFLLAPERSLMGPPAENLADWDRLTAERRVPAIGGVDAHQAGLRIGGRVLSPMPNERFFSFLRTHVLLPDPPAQELEHDRAMVYEALREGRCYLALDVIEPATGFGFAASGLGGQLAAMGAEVRRGRWSFEARTPRAARITLLRSGRAVHETHGEQLAWESEEPGVYRIEARLPWRSRERLWIVSNPIYVRG
jgi:PHP domain